MIQLRITSLVMSQVKVVTDGDRGGGGGGDLAGDTTGHRETTACSQRRHSQKGARSATDSVSSQEGGFIIHAVTPADEVWETRSRKAFETVETNLCYTSGFSH